MIDFSNSQLSNRRQCELLGLNRSSYYYEPTQETSENLRFMMRIDEQYLKTPNFGRRRMAIWLARDGEEVNRKRIKRLMALMGLEAIHPGPRASDHGAGPGSQGVSLSLERSEGRASGSSLVIRYHLHSDASGLHVLDGGDRPVKPVVLSWSLSNSLDGLFCLESLEEALRGGKLEIFNTDQGVQFTARSFTGRLEAAGVLVSMDGRGRVLDNVFLERLWRSLKYVDVYLKDYRSMAELMTGLTSWFRFYNHERPRQSLKYRTPAEVYQEAGKCSGRSEEGQDHN